MTLDEIDNLEHADPKARALLLAESDKRIASQVQILLGADARSNGLLAGTTALSGAAIAVAVAQAGPNPNLVLFWASVFFGLGCGTATLLTLWSLWPIAIDIPGWSPKLFLRDVAANKSVPRIESEVLSFNQVKLDDNLKIIQTITGRTKCAFAALALAPVWGTSAGLIVADIQWSWLGVVIGSLSLLFVARVGFELRTQH